MHHGHRVMERGSSVRLPLPWGESSPLSLSPPLPGRGGAVSSLSIGGDPPFESSFRPTILPLSNPKKNPNPTHPEKRPYPPHPGKWTPLSLKPPREGGSIPGRSSVDHEPHHTDAMATAASTHARVRTTRGICTANKGWKTKEQRGWMEAKQKKTCQTDTRVVLARATGEPGKVRHATNPARTKTKRTTKDA